MRSCSTAGGRLTATSIQVNSELMARAAFNALAFLPARSKYKLARITVSPEGIEFMTTDGYAAGQDSVAANVPYLGPTVTAYVERDGLADLDEAGRKDKASKERIGLGTFTVTPDDGILFLASKGERTGVMISFSDPDPVWEALDEMFTRHEDRDPYLPDVICFDPTILSRFAKVKTDKDGRMMDCKLSGDKLEPVLVKIGPTFRGLIMPIDRGVNGKLIGEDGLW